MNQVEKRAALRQQWQALVSQYQATNQSVRGWCQEQNIAEHKMRYWLRVLAEEASPTVAQESRFVAVTPQQHDEIPSGVAVRIGNLSIAVHRDFDPQVLIDVVQSLIGYDQ